MPGRLDFILFENILSNCILKDPKLYQKVTDYLINVAPCRTGADDLRLQESWDASIRIIDFLLSPQNIICTDICDIGSTELWEISVKILYKVHPSTQQADRSSDASETKKKDIDAVLMRYGDGTSLKVESALSLELSTGFAKLDEDVKYYSPPSLEEKIRIVKSSKDIAYAFQYLITENRANVVGIDVEWKPMVRPNEINKCSLLQIACHSHIFLFDLMILEPGAFRLKTDNSETRGVTQEFSSLITQLLTSERILKIG